MQNNPYKISKHADGDREQLSFQSGYETLMTFSDIIVDIMLIVPKFVCVGYLFLGGRGQPLQLLDSGIGLSG